MKVQYKEYKSGKLIKISMSLQDLNENDLYNCFSTNRLNEHTLIKKGKFFNFINNYLVSDVFMKYGSFGNVDQKPMQYEILGDSNNFVEVYALVHSSNGDITVDREKTISEVSKNSPVGLFDQEKNGWELNRN